jgi:hypothetical protein
LWARRLAGRSAISGRRSMKTERAVETAVLLPQAKIAVYVCDDHAV